MRRRGGLKFWALLVALLLAIPVAAAALYSSNADDSVSIGDQLSASLLQPFTDAESFGDSVSAYLVSTFSQPVSDAMSFGDTLVAQLAQPYADAMSFGDTLVAQLSHPYSDAMGFGETLVATLVQPYADAVNFGDSLSAYLTSAFSQESSDAVSFGDSLVAQLSQPYTDAVNFGDSLLATLSHPYTDAVNFGDSLVAVLSQPYTDIVNFGDALVATLYHPYADAMNIGDSILAQLIQPFNDSVAIGDQLSTMLLSAMNTAIAEAVQIGDQLSTGLLTPYNDAVAITEQLSTVKISISGVTNSQITTDSSGNTLIAGTDASGNLVTQVTLPPGTTMGPSVTINYATRGSDSITQVSGFTVPYPPGKTVTMLNAAGVTSVCIVDSPTGATLQSAVCGATDLSNSHVILACDGAPHTYAPFPSGPSSRTYTCTQTTLGGKSYLQVSGLAFSTTIVDATPPTLALPSDITVVLTSRAGAPVTFSASASDLLDPSPAVSCSARSGATFPLGTTTVTCTAKDAAGNEATGSFHVSVVYKFGGFLPPLQVGATYHIGSVIPVRFALTDAAGREVYFATGKVAAGSVTGAFRLEGDHYEFDLETKGMPAGPLTIYVSPNDGTTHSITIDLTPSFLTSLSLTCSPPKVFPGATTRCDATVTSQDGPTPTGAVAFSSSDGHGRFGKVSCYAGDQGHSGQGGDGGGAMSCSVDYSSPSLGAQTINAAYPGDAHDLPSSASFHVTVASIPTTTSLACNPSSVQPGKATRCVADVESQDGSSPTGGVTFSSSDSHGAFGKVACSTQSYPRSEGRQLECTVDYTPSVAGAQTITAVYSGDSTHSSSKGAFLLNRDRGDATGPAFALATLAMVAMGMTALYPFLKPWRPVPSMLLRGLVRRTDAHEEV